jgi:hypothetical protein
VARASWREILDPDCTFIWQRSFTHPFPVVAFLSASLFKSRGQRPSDHVFHFAMLSRLPFLDAYRRQRPQLWSDPAHHSWPQAPLPQPVMLVLPWFVWRCRPQPIGRSPSFGEEAIFVACCPRCKVQVPGYHFTPWCSVTLLGFWLWRHVSRSPSTRANGLL